VVLTRIWAVLLAVLATGALAGMFMLSGKSTDDFSEADRSALRAVTEAGVAALEAEIASSPVRHAAGMLRDKELTEALSRDDDAAAEGERTVADIVAELAEQVRVAFKSDMTVGVIDDKGQIKAANGVAEALVGELVGLGVFQDAPADSEQLASVTLGGELHVAFIGPTNDLGYRLVAIEVLKTGAGSLLRRVLGSTMPAGLVRRGKLTGDIIGDQPVTAELEELAGKHRSEAPESGASKVFTIGEGINARIGAIGRVPGPAGRGDNGVMLTVLSGQTAAATQQDLAEALSQARHEGGLERVNWILLGGLLVVCIGLGVYLPSLEGLGPMQRLAREFNAIAQGAQHSVFHDRYSGSAGEVARAAAAAHEALRQAYLAELEIDEEEEGELDPDEARARPRTTRGRRLPTRGHRRAPTGARSRVNKQVMGADAGVEERVTARNVPAPAATPYPTPAPAPFSPAPAPIPTPAPTPVVAPPPPAARPAPAPPAPRATPVPAAPPASAFAPPPADDGGADGDDDDSYYREVYEEFLQVKMACGEPTNNFSLDKFAKKLAKQTADIKKKRPDAADVQFSVYVKDGKAALKARIVKA
jgi:hypothetical protein